MAQKVQSKKLTEGPMPRLLIGQSLPLLFALIAMMSYSVADTFWVAQLGTEPLAAISFCGSVTFFITSIGLGIGAGVSSVVSRKLGAGDEQGLSRVVNAGLLLGLAVSALTTLLGLLTLGQLFTALGASAEVMPGIKAYMVPFYLGAGSSIMLTLMEAMLRGHGLAGLAGKLLVAGALLNIALDPLFIFGGLGLPAMGIQGAAIASIVSRLLVVLYLLPGLVRREIISWESVGLRVILKIWRAILHVGLPATASLLMAPLSGMVLLGLVAGYGTEAVAAFGMASRLQPLTLIPFFALSSAVGPIAGQNLGAGRFDRLGQMWGYVLRWSLVFSVIVSLALGSLSPYLLVLFSSDPAILQISSSYFWIVPISYGFMGISMNASASCNGLGRPLPGTLISFMRALGLCIPMALVFEWGLGLRGIFVGISVSNVVVGIAASVMLRRLISRLEARDHADLG